jgi:hypothetical protein
LASSEVRVLFPKMILICFRIVLFPTPSIPVHKNNILKNTETSKQNKEKVHSKEIPRNKNVCIFGSLIDCCCV